ncbi:hypothetical protein AGMMS49965_22060 [Bacteroidia bacterium]|nr:hypothetical protein AGMMS49965_22060 [Bacteroidia bacterium]
MKKNKIFYGLATIFFAGVVVLDVSTILAQDTAAVARLKKYVQTVQVFNQLIPQEKVYLHFDNTSYVLGETIWFKAYVVTAGQFQSTNQSGVLYVELLNSKGKVLETKKLKIEEGQCRGEFVLKEINLEYFPGFYEIRAYTKGMLNFGEETIFSRVFPVFKEFKLNGDYTPKDLDDDLEFSLPNYRKKGTKQKKINVDFYPEGGNLVNGLTSNVAFQITDEAGNGLEATGIVYSPEGEPVTTFSTLHAGMGAFSYTPDNKQNKVKITCGNKEYTFDLPKSLDKGYMLQTNNFSKSALMLRLEKSPNAPSVPLIFILQKMEDKIAIKAIPNKEEYEPQEKIIIDFAVTGESDYPETVFSLAVRDANQTLKTDDAENIATNLLLSSDLKGYVEKPGYYLEQGNMQALDILLMVRGWKRYEWQTMAGIKPFNSQFNIEKKLTIKGFIPASEGKNAEVGILMQQDALSMTGTVNADGKGVFYFYPEEFYGIWNITLRAKGVENGAKNIRIDQWFSPAPRTYSSLETVWEANPLSIMKQGKENKDIKEIKSDEGSTTKSYQIPEVVVRTSRRKRNKDIIHQVGRNIDRAIDKGEKIPYNVHDWLLENDENYSFGQEGSTDNPVHATGNDIDMDGRSSFEGSFYYHRPTIAKYLHLEDGKWQKIDKKILTYKKSKLDVEVKDLTAKRVILDVDKIVISGFKQVDAEGKLYTPIYIYPYKSYSMRTIPGTRYTTFEGYSKAKDFYWDRQEREDYVPNVAEHQRTLYWNPDVKTDNQGEAHIHFYNDAFCKKIDISAEGLTTERVPIANKKLKK